jgi:alpha-D-ribose 1-methylphosphonate 5-phosphate C-P lyase
MHGEGDYSRLLTRLYEDIVQFEEITIAHRYPTRIAAHYVIDPSPIPRYDVPRLHHSPALILLGAGRERKIYAVPPYTDAVPLAFDDVPFRVEAFLDPDGVRRPCARCGATDTYLDEFLDAAGAKVYQCSDSHCCNERCLSGQQEGAR